MWDEARKRWEKADVTSWDFGDLPQRVELGKDALGLPVYAYPGLAAEGQTAAIRLFSGPDAAKEASLNGLLLLYQWAFAAELKQLRRTWVFPNDLAAMGFFMGSRQEAARMLQLYLLRELFDLHAPQWPEHSHFQAAKERLQGRMGALSQELLSEVFEAIKERQATKACLQRLQKLAVKNQAVLEQLSLLFRELEELVPADFLAHHGRHRIRALPRYLKAIRRRAERAYAAPEKDRVKAEQVAPFCDRYEQLKQEVMMRPNVERLCFLDELRWMLEELKVSLFAPEIKGPSRISVKRLEEKFAQWQALKDRE
jgi:ATP-dependent helicase HrpA